MVYALPLPCGHLNYNITQLEMLNIMIALKIWGHAWQNMRIEIKCDNLAVVQVLKDGKARDPLLATIARNIWMLTSLFNIQFLVSHIEGKDNAIADLLSHWWVTDNRSKKLQNYYRHISGYLHILILSSLITVFSTCLLINPCVSLG